MNKTKDAIFGGALTLQALPMLKVEGRTPAALATTTTGFVGIGVVGTLGDVAFGMVKSRADFYEKNMKRKGGK